MQNSFSNIEKLKKLVWQGTPKYKFNTRIERSEIDIFEKAYGLVLSESYKQFLEEFNGGMILEYEESYYTDMTEWEPDGPKWSSFSLFSLSELIEKYRSVRLENWLLEVNNGGIYPIIPICNTPKQALLFMVSAKGLSNESPVFASYNDSGKYICTKIATDFNSFLGYYLESDGFPALLPDDTEPSWEVFMKKTSILEIANATESYKDSIVRSTALIELFPDNEWSYCERGNSYLYNQQIELALADFNKAIALDDQEAFFYHCRGDLILKYGSPRKALIDLDIAVKLEPEHKLFRIKRAEAFYKLKKLDKALADCNKVLAVDSHFLLALYTRIDVYKALGKHDKAKIDADLLDEISA